MTDTPNRPDPDDERPDLTSGDPLRDEPEAEPSPAARADVSGDAPEPDPQPTAGADEPATEPGTEPPPAARADVSGDAPEPEPQPAAGADEPATEPGTEAPPAAGADEPRPSFVPPRAHRDPLGEGPERPYYDGPDLAAAATADTPRRLTRSSSDRLIAGVAGGLGRYFNVDPLIFRISFVVLTFAGGFGLLAYLIGVVAIPDENAERPQRWGLWRTLGAGLLAAAALAAVTPNWLHGAELPGLVACGVVLYLLVRVIRDEGGAHLARTAARIALGIMLFSLATAGFAAAAAGTALGGGILVAGTVIALGVALVGGAFRGGARWLIVPAFVLALPLGIVSAADLEVDGPWGERTYRPTSVATVSDGYRMGIGHMQVDLRGVELPEGRTEMPVKLGMGELDVAVPEDVCVTYDVEVGIGEIRTLDGVADDGVDLDVTGAAEVPAGVRELHVIADLGVGAVQIDRDFTDRFEFGRRFDRPRFDGGFPPLGSRNTACEATA